MARVNGASEIIVGEGLPEPVLPPSEGRKQVAVLTQPAATGLAMDLADSLRSNGLGIEVIGLPDREEAKRLDVVASVYDTLGRLGLGIDDTIVGVGGGSVTDVAGFVAGTWLRGVEVVHVPTTFLGAIDAAIGGKTGVNVGGKNTVGVFWKPTRVIIDFDTLRSLPGYLLREGMAEAYKMGLVGDFDLAALFDADGLDASFEDVVTRSIAVKTGLVEADPYDRGVRAYLNFGHTLGHAIEYASPLSHGEGVALGMVAAVRISEQREGFMGADRVIETLQMMGLPVAMEGLDRGRVVDLVGRDKKRNADGLRMVLLRSVGEPVLTHVSQEDIDVGLSAIGL